MTWFILFGLGFFWAWKARQGAEFLKKNPNHPNTFNTVALIGIFYIAATLTLGMFPLMMLDYTDNIIVVLVLCVPAGLVGFAAWEEYNGNMILANQKAQWAFYAMAAGIMIMSFTVPAEDYNFPEQEQQLESTQEAPVNTWKVLPQ